MVKFNFDSWENELTGLGIKDRDKRMSSVIGTSAVFSQPVLDDLYRGDSLAKKICNMPAKEMTREGITIIETEKINPDVIKNINKDMKRLGLWRNIRRALQWSRLYRGGVVNLIIEDGGKSEEPVNINNIKRIRGAYDLNSFQIYPIEYQANAEEPNYGEPEIYQLLATEVMPTQGSKITVEPVSRWHRSRLLIFDGVDLPQHLRLQNQGWGDSVFQSIYNELRNYHQGQDGAATLVADFAQAVFKIKNLHAQVAANSGDVVASRLNVVNLARSIIGATLIDADGEEFERKVTPVSGLADLLDRSERALIAASEMPHTILFGDSPSGLGATGNHEMEVWKDNVKAMQEDKIRSELDRYFKYYSASTESKLNGEEIDYEFNSLFQMSEKEQADIRKTISEADKNNIQFGVYSNREARTRYEGDGFSMNISLDESFDDTEGEEIIDEEEIG